MLAKSKKRATPLRPNRGAKHKNSGRGPDRNEMYKAFVRKFLCIACVPATWMGRIKRTDPLALASLLDLNNGASEAMHTGPHGARQKASDYTCLPGCRKHHHELDHQIGRAFWKKYQLDRVKLIAALRAEYERTKAISAGAEADFDPRDDYQK